MELPSLISSLSLIDDRRSNKNKRYPLPLLLLIAFCASISKHNSWYTMQDYAQAHEASLRELYKQLFGEELEHITPTHDTLNRALQLIPHQLFKQAYQDWISALLRWEDETRQICIDGKTMRGVKKLSPNTESHIVSAYDSHLQLVLSVNAVPIKCHELESIRRLLDELDVTNALITLDALGCQRQVADQILQVGGNYLLQVKSKEQSADFTSRARRQLSPNRQRMYPVQRRRPRTWTHRDTSDEESCSNTRDAGGFLCI